MNVNRWALRNDTAVPNPAAGLGVGRAETPRSEMALPNKSAASQWHPTVVNLGILIVLEVLAFTALRYFFRTAHGG